MKNFQLCVWGFIHLIISAHGTVLSTLNLKTNQIGDMGLMSLSGGINPNSSLKTLNVDDNQVSPFGGMSLASLASRSGNLQNISLGKNMVGPSVGVAMAAALASNPMMGKIQLPETGQDMNTAMAFAHVTEASPHVNYFDSNAIPMDPNDLSSILSTLKNATNLTDLNLANSNLGDMGASQVATMLSTNFTITSANVSNNSISDTGANAFAGALKANRTLQILNMGSNSISDTGALALASAAAANNTLKKLDLTGCSLNPMGKMSLKQIQRMNPNLEILYDDDSSSMNINEEPGQLQGYATALPFNPETSTTWDLNKLNAGPPLVGLVGNILMTRPTQVQNLQMSDNQIGDQGAVSLATLLSNYANVSTLDLSNNNITPMGASAIAGFISQNPNLETLNLSNNPLGPTGIAMIAKAIAQHPRLKALQLDNTECGDSGIMGLTSMLSLNFTLTSLSLEKNQIGDTGATMLAKILMTNLALTDLNLADNQIGPRGAMALSGLFAKGTVSGVSSKTSALSNIATLNGPSVTNFSSPQSLNGFSSQVPSKFTNREMPLLGFKDINNNNTVGRFENENNAASYASTERLSALSKVGFNKSPSLTMPIADKPLTFTTRKGTDLSSWTSGMDYGSGANSGIPVQDSLSFIPLPVTQSDGSLTKNDLSFSNLWGAPSPLAPMGIPSNMMPTSSVISNLPGTWTGSNSDKSTIPNILSAKTQLNSGTKLMGKFK